MVEKKFQIDVKVIIIFLLAVLGVKLLFFNQSTVVYTDTSKLDDEIISLQDSLVSLNDSMYYSKEAIKVNRYIIDSLYVSKRIDSIKLSKMTIGGRLTFFKDYINNVSPVVLITDSTIINSGYINGANSIFLDHDVKVNELRLLYANVNQMESIIVDQISTVDITKQIGDTQLMVNTLKCDEIKKLNKQYKQQLRTQKLIGIAGVILIIIVLV